MQQNPFLFGIFCSKQRNRRQTQNRKKIQENISFHREFYIISKWGYIYTGNYVWWVSLSPDIIQYLKWVTNDTGSSVRKAAERRRAMKKAYHFEFNSWICATRRMLHFSRFANAKCFFFTLTVHEMQRVGRSKKKIYDGNGFGVVFPLLRFPGSIRREIVVCVGAGLMESVTDICVLCWKVRYVRKDTNRHGGFFFFLFSEQRAIPRNRYHLNTLSSCA